MGSNCGFLAFRSAPDVEKLLGIEWLDGFTLFKRKGREQWYMEGPLPEKEGISFYQPLDVRRGDLHPFSTPEAKAVVAWLNKTIDGVGVYATYDDVALSEGLLISRALGADVLVVFGNDEDLDGALVCSKGRLVGGSLYAGESDVLRITGERQATVVTIAPEDEHDLPNSFYRRAIEEAGRFFGELELVPHWSDFTAHAPEQYELVASKAPSGRRARSATRKKGLLDYFFKR